MADLAPVLQSGMCIACGACVAADPSLKLELDAKRQMYQPTHAAGERAASVCPALRVDFAGLQARLFPGQTIGPHGAVDSVWLAQSCDRERNLKASSGGVIKELIRDLLERGEVDGAIALSGVGGLRFEPRLLTRPEQVDSLPGSIYHNLPLDGALRLLRESTGRLALVAIPCQLEGIYSYLFSLEPELRERLVTTVGLICGWNYSHHALRALCDYKRIDFDRIQELAYRGGGPVGMLRIQTPAGERRVHRRVDFDYQVAFDRSFNVARCHLCVNHCNFLAETVVGDAWLPSTVHTRAGISLVICRTAAARERLVRLRDAGRLKLAQVSAEEITESQSRRITFGDFAYAYADYLRSAGLHAPVMSGPNRPHARIATAREAARFHRTLQLKRRLQEASRYRALWWRKATVEIGPFLWRYVRWFGVRVLKLKSWLGLRKEVASGRLADFE